ncbi:MAG: hypothetical protein O2960_12090 [Verrucomicrobia bacterium]|nr:hypothetical protein [Verrucomicrobiota bacterium]
MIISRMDSVLLTERQKTERIGEMLNAMVIIRESVSNQERWELVRMKISRLGDMAEDLRELDEFSAEVETAALDDSAPTLLSTEINQARQKVTDLASASISHQEEKWDRNRNDWRNQIKRVGRFVLNTSRLMASSSHGFIVYALSALVGVGLWMVCGEGWILLSSLDIFSFGLFTFLLDWSVKEIWKELEEGIDVAQLFINGIMHGFSMATVFFFVSLYLWSPGHFPAFRRKRVTH